MSTDVENNISALGNLAELCARYNAFDCWSVAAAVAAGISAWAAYKGLTFSNEAVKETKKQACRETFDRSIGNKFFESFDQINIDIATIRSLFLSQNANQTNINNATAVAKDINYGIVRFLCSEIDPNANLGLISLIDDLEREVSNIIVQANSTVGDATIRHNSISDSCDKTDRIARKIKKAVLLVRQSYIP